MDRECTFQDAVADLNIGASYIAFILTRLHSLSRTPDRRHTPLRRRMAETEVSSHALVVVIRARLLNRGVEFFGHLAMMRDGRLQFRRQCLDVRVLGLGDVLSVSYTHLTLPTSDLV